MAGLFAAEGASVACLDLDESRSRATAQSIAANGGRALALGGDVTAEADCEHAVEQTHSAFGALDILVNNAGMAGPLNLEDVTLAAWRRQIDANLTSAMLMMRAAVPRMAAAGGGNVVNISSLSGMRTMGALAYGPAKAALRQLGREVGVLHGRQGIRVNTLAPGHMMTPMAMRHLPAEMREARRKVGPLGLEGDAWDVAQAALFLGSDEARFVNGVQLAVDGGVEGIAPLTGVAFRERP
ncbi:SDR family oxidoreductase [Sphingomonas sp. MG17]|uniref:SDR family oxidoreductase n=1 Tax=Sphingomonas tagetis TaxID=2949092 RepID=A0A9X2HL89_9SPHN|nr:SDR family oxidoreductase [Sphingomonas tagetis]